MRQDHGIYDDPPKLGRPRDALTCPCCGKFLPVDWDACTSCDRVEDEPQTRPFRKPFKESKQSLRLKNNQSARRQPDAFLLTLAMYLQFLM